MIRILPPAAALPGPTRCAGTDDDRDWLLVDLLAGWLTPASLAVASSLAELSGHPDWWAWDGAGRAHRGDRRCPQCTGPRSCAAESAARAWLLTSIYADDLAEETP
jgi:hypothetical protein